MKYSIQLGAFANVDNAARLTSTLESRGLDAYYFRHSSGLFKVRCGDFASRTEALHKAENLVASGVIREYYLVKPDEHAATVQKKYAAIDLRNRLVRTATSYLGLPYRWGGSSPRKGFDCSGLTMAVYRLNGLKLPRSSRQQFKTGYQIPPGKLLKGDLVFFYTSGGHRISHVGIYIGHGKFIHAPGTGKQIRIDRLDNVYYSRHFAGARTYLQ
ncbi:MAG: C40 family peptidase [Deltaproteobacteria bacterium]|nr:C40 family peptidase [Deltaproteobacteria bacterium]MBW2072520.1 C40 family peptidase [Deltaproteobacteria bacterium]